MRSPLVCRSLADFPMCRRTCHGPNGTANRSPFSAKSILPQSHGTPSPKRFRRMASSPFLYDCEQSAWGFDPNDKGSWRVYFSPHEPLCRTSPSIPIPEHAAYASCGLTFADGLTFPGGESLYIQALNLTDGERYKYLEFHADQETGSDAHQLLGHPSELQGEISSNANWHPMESIVAMRKVTNILLFVLLNPAHPNGRFYSKCDSDDNVGWMWCHVGRLYFWITESDLMSRRFENVWMILQCS